MPSPAGLEWLIVPVKRSGRRGQLVRDAEIDDSKLWKKKHLRKLHHYYRNAPYFDDVYPRLKEVIENPWTRIADMNVAVVARIASMLRLSCRFVRASSLDVSGGKSQLLINILKALDGGVFLCGGRGRKFLNSGEFAAHGIALDYGDFHCPENLQKGGAVREDVSIFDALCRRGRTDVYALFSPR